MTQLEPEQAELLSSLCEAARSQNRHERQSFHAIEFGEGSTLRHPRLPGGGIDDPHFPDLELLAKYQLIHVSSRNRDGMVFDVTPEGFAHWETLKAKQGSGVDRIQKEIRSYIESAPFRARFATAFDKWAQAEEKLWSAESDRQFTTIGHECREAIQAFASAAGASPNQNAASDVDNVRRGLNALKGRVPESLTAMLDALLPYWGTMTDLVQRQEHGASKEGEPIGWEDARAVVFQTSIVMFEFARALDRAR